MARRTTIFSQSYGARLSKCVVRMMLQRGKTLNEIGKV